MKPSNTRAFMLCRYASTGDVYEDAEEDQASGNSRERTLRCAGNAHDFHMCSSTEHNERTGLTCCAVYSSCERI